MTKLRQLTALIFFPIIFSSFIVDRVICAFFWWFRIQSFKEWSNDPERMAYSLLRVMIFCLFYGLHLVWK